VGSGLARKAGTSFIPFSGGTLEEWVGKGLSQVKGHPLMATHTGPYNHGGWSPLKAGDAAKNRHPRQGAKAKGTLAMRKKPAKKLIPDINLYKTKFFVNIKKHDK